MKRELLHGEYIWVIRDFMSPVECRTWIELAESSGFSDAPITTARGQVMNTSVRNNRRVMIDSHERAERLWKRLAPAFAVRASSSIAPLGINERIRFYRYDPGQRFRPHLDGAFHREGTGERSLYTFMVYLNDDFEGGETRFYEHGHVVVPETGMALLFIHRQLHEGCTVTKGTKYVLRSDVMYDLGLP